MVKKFTILGERCSGTNYLEELMLENFDIEITWDYGWKHHFGWYNFQKTEEEDITLFIGIVRHPIYWINSFFEKQHHIEGRPLPIYKFLINSGYSVDDNGDIIRESLNFITGNKYKNIFELRFLKNYYLINTMPNNVKNYILINYENLRDNTEKILTMIENKYLLTRKHLIFKNITYYKKEKNETFKKKELSIPSIYLNICASKFNKIQEAKLGYNL